MSAATRVRLVLAAGLFLATLTSRANDGLPLRMELQGSGDRTVVFEAGLGDTFEVWRRVQSQVAANCARTVSYTRAGYPRSPPAQGARDARTIVDELRASLRTRGIPPPYVLVGHSLGGLYVQYFARNYPQEVSGVLLVDPTHPRQLERLKTEAPGAYRTLKTASLLMSPIMKRELADSEVAGEQVLASPAWADMPVVVLSSTRASLGELPSFRTLETRLQDEIAASIPSARHERVQGSGHYIQRDRPEVVIRVARQLAGCAG